MSHKVPPAKPAKPPSIVGNVILTLFAAFLFFCSVCALTFGRDSGETATGLIFGVIGLLILVAVAKRIEARIVT